MGLFCLASNDVWRSCRVLIWRFADERSKEGREYRLCRCMRSRAVWLLAVRRHFCAQIWQLSSQLAPPKCAWIYPHHTPRLVIRLQEQLRLRYVTTLVWKWEWRWATVMRGAQNRKSSRATIATVARYLLAAEIYAQWDSRASTRILRRTCGISAMWRIKFIAPGFRDKMFNIPKNTM